MSLPLQLELEEFYPHPVATVWQALTDPAAIAQWLMPCDFQPVPGHRFVIRGNATENWRGFTRCQVLTVDAPSLMEWLWESADIEEPTRVSFRLQAVEGGTRLLLHHTGTTLTEDIESLSEGWPLKLRHLEAYLMNARAAQEEGEPGVGYQKTVELNASVKAAYAALTSGIDKWWTTGSSDGSEPGSILTTRFGDTYNHIRVSHLLPGKKVIWEILEHHHANEALTRQDEWTGTRILWILTDVGGGRTRLDFAHEGLIDTMECWDICEAGWDFFLLESLKPYLEEGTGQPYQHGQ